MLHTINASLQLKPAKNVVESSQQCRTPPNGGNAIHTIEPPTHPWTEMYCDQGGTRCERAHSETKVRHQESQPVSGVFGLPVSGKTRSNREKKRVGMTGIEPALLAELDPKSSASASFATSPGGLSPGARRRWWGRVEVV